MTAVDYEREALRVLGLPHPSDTNPTSFHHIGETEIGDNPDACRAIVARRLTKVRHVLDSAHILPAPARALIEDANVLTYGEYADTVRRVVSIRERLQKIENTGRKRDFDRSHRDNTYFYAEHNAPKPQEAHLARIFDPERFTSDWPGYVAYLAEVASPLREFFYRRLPVLIPEDARQRHTYITGQSGSGKSEFLKVLINAYLRNHAPVSLVLIDPHGDLAEQVARLPEVATSGRLIYIRPGLAAGMTATLNPFELADTSEGAVHVMAEQLAAVFNELMRQAGHAGLSGNMGALLTPCISTLLRRPGSTIRDLQTFMDDKRNRDLFDLGCGSPLAPHRDFFRERFYEKQFESTKAALYTRIQSLLNSPVLYRLLVGPSTVNLEEAVNAGKIIIFGLPKGTAGGETTPLFGVFILAMLQGIAIRRDEIPVAERVPIHAFIDECQNFLSPTVRTILTEARKFGLHLTLAQQHFGQDMQPDLMASVISNTAVKVCGMNDVKTLKPMDERLGVGLDALQRLGVGQFFVKVSGNAPAFKLRAPHIRAAISNEAWEATKARQLRDYYRANEEQPPEANTEATAGRPQAQGMEISPDTTPPRSAPPKPGKVDFV
jgi:energy-coupling factor transporter ATP-binding protein EcfA2